MRAPLRDGDTVQLDVARDPARLHRRRRLEAQQLLDRVAEQRRVVDQLLALVGVLGQGDRAEPEHAGDGLGARERDELHEPEDLLERERAGLPVLLDLGVHETGEQVVLRVLAALLHELGDDGEGRLPDLAVLRHHRRHRHHAALLGGALVDVQGLGGEVAELLGVAVGIADQRQDHRRRQQPRERGDVVELVLSLHGVEELPAELADAPLEVGDRTRGEGAGHQLAQPSVRRRVLHDHHLDVLVGLRRDHLEDDAVARPERVGVDQPVEHVVVPAQRVEVVLLVEVDGRLVTEPTPDRIRIGVDRVVPRVVVDVSGGHGPRLRESSASDGPDDRVGVEGLVGDDHAVLRERVGDGVEHRRRRRDGTTLTDALVAPDGRGR